MHRKNEEIEALLKEAEEKEAAIMGQNEIIQQEKTALETEDAILSTLMQVIPDRVTIKDKAGKYLKVSNSKLKSLREKGFDNVVGKSDRDMIGEEHFQKSYTAEKEIMKSDKSVFDVEERVQISESETIWGSTSRVPLKDKRGKIIGTVVVTRNITKEKEYSEELERLKEIQQ